MPTESVNATSYTALILRTKIIGIPSTDEEVPIYVQPVFLISVGCVLLIIICGVAHNVAYEREKKKKRAAGSCRHAYAGLFLGPIEKDVYITMPWC